MSVAIRFLLLAVISASVVRAEPADDVRAAISALWAASGYGWETIARQNAQDFPDFPKATTRLEDQPKVVDVRGKTVRSGLAEIIILPGRPGIDVPVTAYIKSSVEAVAGTPIGWLTRQEMRDSPRARETVSFEGKPVRLQRFFVVATRATNIEMPGDELRGLLADIAAYEGEGEEIVGRLQPGAAIILRDSGRRGSGGSSQAPAGQVIFRLRDGALREYEVRLTTEVTRVGRSPIRRIERWITTLNGIGSTSVHAPREAAAKLAD